MSDPIQLPDSCQPILSAFNLAEQSKFKTTAELRTNIEKAREADLALAEAQNGDPADPASSQRLTDCMMRSQLYKNNQVSLERRLAEAIGQANKAARALARELRKIGMEHRAQDRMKLREELSHRLVNSPVEIERGLESADLRSKEGVRGWMLEGDAQGFEDNLKGGADAFMIWPHLLAIWVRFQNRDQKPAEQS